MPGTQISRHAVVADQPGTAASHRRCGLRHTYLGTAAECGRLLRSPDAGLEARLVALAGSSSTLKTAAPASARLLKGHAYDHRLVGSDKSPLLSCRAFSRSAPAQEGDSCRVSRINNEERNKCFFSLPVLPYCYWAISSTALL